MIDYHKYVGYCRPDEKEKNRWEGGGGRWDEEKPVENKPVENKPVESGGDYSTNSSIRSRDIHALSVPLSNSQKLDAIHQI